jgi:hypothetical protein
MRGLRVLQTQFDNPIQPLFPQIVVPLNNRNVSRLQLLQMRMAVLAR